jgi:beta-N-acetylhexosaminidase
MIGLPGDPTPQEARSWLAEVRPAGVILFQRHCTSAAAVECRLRELRDAAGEPLLFAVDQEGGRVNRFRDWLGSTPGARSLAAAGEEAARQSGHTVGRLLQSLGFNVDFAPVVDLSPADRPNGIGDRAWSTDPDRTTCLAGAFLEGLQSEGVAGCLKHFPGLGETFSDSHLSLPVCNRTAEELECGELLPFRMLHENAAMIMISHAAYPILDGNTPASLSRRIIQGELKERMGYRGLVVSDDLEMGALAEHNEAGREAVAALRAGCDMLIYGNRKEPVQAAIKAVRVEVDRDPDFATRVREAIERVDETCRRWPVSLRAPGR